MLRDFTYVEDIVDGLVRSMDKPLGFCIINLGNGKPVNLMDFVNIIEKKLGKKAIINFLPMQEGDVGLTYADITKARNLLGYNPKTSIKEGVDKFVDWYIKYYEDKK